MPKEHGFFLSVRKRLLFAFVLLIFLPYALTTTYYAASMRQQLLNETSATLASDAQLLLRGVEGMMAETRRIAYLHLVDQDIARILQTRHESYDLSYVEDERTMLSAIRHTTSLNNNVLTVIFYAQDDTTYQQSYIPSLSKQNSIEWRARMEKSGERIYVAPVQPSTTGTVILPVVYALVNTLGTEVIGYAQVDYDLKALWNNTLLQCTGSGSFALLQDDQLLWNTGDWVFDSQSLQGAKPLKDDVKSMQSGTKQIAAAMLQHEKTRLSIVAYQNISSWDQPAMQRLTFYLLLLGVLLLGDLLISLMISSQIGNNVRELASAMDNAKHGENHLLPIAENVRVTSEFDQLRESYNAMIERLNSSAKREYEVRMQQKSIAMRVLESQINPHFLYNALNLIASLAQLCHQEHIRSVAISLAAILRYSIKGGSIVALEEELAQTNHYINIIKMRFPDRIIVRTDVDHRLLKCRMPKLILQPLLENASKYATDTVALMVTLSITVYSEGNDLFIIVADNGPGIPPQKLADICDTLARYSVEDTTIGETAKSLGLINVHARLRAHYGAPYGVTIDSTDQGCSVTVRLPKDEDKSDDAANG
ncbi:MAG: histidine kinase [Clostridia bacterium]